MPEKKELFPFGVSQDKDGFFCIESTQLCDKVCRGTSGTEELQLFVDKTLTLPTVLRELAEPLTRIITAPDFLSRMGYALQIDAVWIKKISSDERKQLGDLDFLPVYMARFAGRTGEPALVKNLKDCPLAAVLMFLDECLMEFLQRHTTIHKVMKN